jgi:hypothetical protein
MLRVMSNVLPINFINPNNKYALRAFVGTLYWKNQMKPVMMETTFLEMDAQIIVKLNQLTFVLCLVSLAFLKIRLRVLNSSKITQL